MCVCVCVCVYVCVCVCGGGGVSVCVGGGVEWGGRGHLFSVSLLVFWGWVGFIGSMCVLTDNCLL